MGQVKVLAEEQKRREEERKRMVEEEEIDNNFTQTKCFVCVNELTIKNKFKNTQNSPLTFARIAI